jgi:hypothetical protein
MKMDNNEDMARRLADNEDTGRRIADAISMSALEDEDDDLTKEHPQCYNHRGRGASEKSMVEISAASRRHRLKRRKNFCKKGFPEKNQCPPDRR